MDFWTLVVVGFIVLCIAGGMKAPGETNKGARVGAKLARRFFFR